MLSIMFDLILFIIELLCRLIVGMVFIVLQQVLNSIQVLFISDFALMEDYFPVVSSTSSIFIIIALALILLIFIWQVFRNFGAGILGDVENPLVLLVKTVIFTFLIFFSKQICSMFMKVTSALTTMFWDIDMGTYDWTHDLLDSTAMTTSLTDLANSFGQLFDGGNTMFDTYNPAGNSVVGTLLGTTAGMSGGASAGGKAVAMIIIVCLLIAICWNFLKLILEIGERYIVMCILYICSPLAFAMGASNSTNQIFKGWCRMFASSLFMMVMNTWSVLLAISSLSNFAQYGVSAETYQYYTLQDGEIVKTGSLHGSLLIWGILTFAFLKCAQSLDEYLNAMGLSTARTGRGLLDDAMAVGRTLMQTANMVKNGIRMGRMQKALSENNARGGAGGAAGASPGIKFNNPSYAARPTQNQRAAADAERKSAIVAAGLSDKQLSGVKWSNKPDTNGNVHGVTADGKPIMKDKNGVISTQLGAGVIAARSPDGSFSLKNEDGSTVTYNANTGVKTTVSDGGKVITTEMPNGSKETVDKNADTITKESPDGAVHKTFGPNSSNYADGIAAEEYNPDTQTLRQTHTDGSITESRCDNMNGYDAAMNDAAAQNARADMQAVMQYESDVADYEKQRAAYGLSPDTVSKVEFGSPDENGISAGSYQGREYTRDSDGNITTRNHSGYTATLDENGNLSVDGPEGAATHTPPTEPVSINVSDTGVTNTSGDSGGATLHESPATVGEQQYTETQNASGGASDTVGVPEQSGDYSGQNYESANGGGAVDASEGNAFIPSNTPGEQYVPDTTITNDNSPDAVASPASSVAETPAPTHTQPQQESFIGDSNAGVSSNNSSIVETDNASYTPSPSIDVESTPRQDTYPTSSFNNADGGTVEYPSYSAGESGNEYHAAEAGVAEKGGYVGTSSTPQSYESTEHSPQSSYGTAGTQTHSDNTSHIAEVPSSSHANANAQANVAVNNAGAPATVQQSASAPQYTSTPTSQSTHNTNTQQTDRTTQYTANQTSQQNSDQPRVSDQRSSNSSPKASTSQGGSSRSRSSRKRKKRNRNRR